MIESKLIVPVNYNDGKPVPNSWFSGLELQLIEAFGGLTVHDATGSWKTPTGSIKREAVRVYTIAHPEGRFSWSPIVLDFARSVKKDLTQEAVYVSIGGKVEFV